MKIARRASPLVASAPDFRAIRFAGWPGFASDCAQKNRRIREAVILSPKDELCRGQFCTNQIRTRAGQVFVLDLEGEELRRRSE